MTFVNKIEAATHIHHAAVRAFIADESALAVHLLAHAAENVISDYAHKRA
jgi:hypothetical protein